jgi:hypothetical protein
MTIGRAVEPALWAEGESRGLMRARYADDQHRQQARDLRGALPPLPFRQSAKDAPRAGEAGGDPSKQRQNAAKVEVRFSLPG